MTDGLPDIELLNATHEFPCIYTFKAIGSPDHQFTARVLAAVKLTLAESAEPSFSTRTTPSRRHISVTIEPEVRDAEHVHEIYRQLQQIEGLFMLL